MNWTDEEYQEYLKKHGKATDQKETKNFTPAKNKRSKYGAVKTWTDGICFDSKLESNFYLKLKQLLAAKKIAGFARQCRFVLSEGTGKDNRAIEYVADWIVLYTNGTFEIIDNKGMETKEFVMKKKMFKNKYPSLDLKVLKEV